MGDAVCAISVDMDAVGCYTKIHGLAAHRGDDPIYHAALERLLSLFRSFGVRATFFVVGDDVEDPQHAALLRGVVAQGHEVANHSRRHVYDLPRLGWAGIHEEIAGAQDQIERACGIRPVGFRAPGYNVSDEVLDCLEALNFAYDSSVFPSPPYYVAKALAMALIRLRGRKSGSAMVDARTQLTPLRPYLPRAGAIFRRGRGQTRRALVELPICVLPCSRFPVIGTSLILAGPRWAPFLLQRAMSFHRSFLGLELHGIDLADPAKDGYTEALCQAQPDLRHSIERKEETMKRSLEMLARHYRFVTCREAALQVSQQML